MSVLVIDVSKWQKEMNWSIAKAAGAKAAFIRAGSISTTGVCYTDYQFLRNARIAPEYMPVGFYWYFRPQFNAEKQADYFCELIQQKDYKLQPVLDEEEVGDRTPYQITKRCVNFALRINENLGVLPLLYSRAYWLNANTVPDPLLKILPLWIARYTSKKKPWGNILPWPDSRGVKPRDFNEWLFWQWSAKGNGRGKEFGATATGAAISMDLNRFNGTQEEFDRYAGVEEPEPVFEWPSQLGVKIDVPVEGEPSVKYRGQVEKV